MKTEQFKEILPYYLGCEVLTDEGVKQQLVSYHISGTAGLPVGHGFNMPYSPDQFKLILKPISELTKEDAERVLGQRVFTTAIKQITGCDQFRIKWKGHGKGQHCRAIEWRVQHLRKLRKLGYFVDGDYDNDFIIHPKDVQKLQDNNQRRFC